MRRPIIAVTGAAGLIGASLVEHLRAAGHRAIACHRGEPGLYEDECRLDILRPEQFAVAMEQGFRADVIVHLAGKIDIALAPDPLAPTDGVLPAQTRVAELYAANVVGSANIVDLARRCGAQKIVFASSQTVYGFGENGVADEETPLRPLEHYAATKVCAEQLLTLASRQGLSVTILRFPGIFSPRRLDGAVQAMCRAAKERGVVTVNAACAIPFDVLALEDLVPAMARSALRDGDGLEIFNLGTGEACSLELLAERVAQLTPGTRVARSGVPQPRFRMTIERATRLLGWQPVPLDRRLEQILGGLVHA